jgi:HEAT repeat protein
LRLAADPSLVIRWPGGLERLADDDPQVRRKAAEELASIATSATQPLLLELFSHSDPLVREISLRGLKNIGGEEAVASLAQLLKDPEPNVRAAVLKQLAEDGAPELLATIANYVEQESDPDLIVHAIRYLSKAQSRRATECLIRLLKHTSWQVRADAAEALGTVLDDVSPSTETAQPIEEVYDGLLALLADSDAFVASRALQALDRVNAQHAVEPLVKATQQHPELAAKIVDILAAGTQMRTAALPHLKNFLTHADPMVRAAAIRGLSVMDAENAEQPLRAAMQDAQAVVRIAAAEGLLSVIAAGRPDASEVLTFSNFNRSVRRAENQNVDDWLAELAAGKHVPEWTTSFTPILEGMLKAESGDERVAACLALAALGKPQAAMPVLLETAPTTSKAFEKCCEVLRWLPREPRVTCFHALEALTKSGEQQSKLILAMNDLPDARNAELYWPALEQPGITREAIEAIDASLQNALLGENYYDPASITAATRREASTALASQAKAGSPLKRLVAINLMLQVAPDDALPLVQGFMNDAAIPPEIRADAFQLYLLGQTAGKATETATASLAGTDSQRRMTSLKFLAIGAETLSYLPHAQLTVHRPSDSDSDIYRSTSPAGEPIVPMPPQRLKPESIRPLLSDPDPETAAYIGYLLTLFGEPEGLPPLLQYWRSLKTPDAGITRLVYRAITALDDPAQLPVLREIYGQLSKADTSEFYWTIRSMTGPEILQFRRLIRQEIGISQLK